MSVKKLLPLCFVPFISFAQTIEKSVSFDYSDYKKTTNKPVLTAIQLDAGSGEIDVYGWHRIEGEVRPEIVKKEKKGGSFLNKMARAMVDPSVLGISTTQGMPATPAVPLLISNRFNPATLKRTSKQEEFIAPSALDPDNKYNMFSTDRLDEMSGKKPVTLNYAAAAEKYPFLAGKQVKRKYAFESEGGRYALAASPSELPIISHPATGELVYKMLKAQNREENARQLEGLRVLESSPIYPIPGSNLHVGIVTKKDKDNWAMYKLFQFIVFDENCTILRIIDPGFEYIRSLNGVTPVIDESGKPRGILLSYRSLVSMASKKQRDPLENRHNIIFIDLEGKPKYQYPIEQGSPENSRGFYPELAIEKGAELHVLSTNVEKILKPYQEVVVLNDKGKVSSTRLDNAKEAGTLSAGDRSQIFVANNKIYLANQNFESDKNLYSTLYISGINPDFTVSSAVKVALAPSSKPAQIELIDEKEATPRFIIASPGGNQIVNLGEKMQVTDITPKGSLMPDSPLMLKNYVYDTTHKKAYFVYETAKSGEGKMVEVSMNAMTANR
ncbi:hypothetical protein [Tellurirhabdus bombi]|uniref:hypothetical protein n=1 Tax=Tellurirhabdus bombi TaxID=2907205 RepID=UPI001F434EE0|nr:hypothetical protein [Tellurirhabdus bombi]